MNKLTKLHLIVPALILLPMSVTAATGWHMTADGKDHVFNARKAKMLTSNNTKAINRLIEDIKVRKLKGERGENGNDGIDGIDGIDGERGERGGIGADGARGHPGERGEQGRAGSKGDVGEKGLAGDSFYAGSYGNMNLLSVIAVGNAVANMPAPTSNGFFSTVGFSDLGGEHAGAIGIHYVDDALSYKATYGHGGHERSIGFGIGIRL